MNNLEVARLLRQLAQEAQALQTCFGYLLVSGSTLPVLQISMIRDLTARLATLSFRMERLAEWAESRRGVSLHGGVRPPHP